MPHRAVICHIFLLSAKEALEGSAVSIRQDY